MTEGFDKDNTITRRNFLITATASMLGISLVTPFSGYCSLPKSRTLSFYHTHTGERFDLSAVNGHYSARDRRKLFTFLRDFRTGDIHPMDIKLFSTLIKIQEITGSKGVYEVISGYRSPQTNKMLRSKTSGVAKSSYHMKGQAIDIRLSDVKTNKLRDIARRLQTGGVGYYRKSDFIHLDTGPVRFW